MLQRIAPLLLACSPLAAQQFVPLAESGQVLPGLGTVQFPYGAAVNDAGDWALTMTLDSGQSALLRSDGSFLVEGAFAAGATGSVLDWIHWNPELTQSGELSWSGILAQPPLFEGKNMLCFEGDAYVAPGDPCVAPGVAPGTTYESFAQPRINDGLRVASHALLLGPAAAESEQALMLFDLDAAGDLVGETLVLREGDVVAGQALRNFGPYDLNDNDDLVVRADFVSNDGALVLLNGSAIAVTDQPAPTGLDWKGFDYGVAINAAGDVAIGGKTDAGFLIARNSTRVAAAGDPVVGAAPGAVFTLPGALGDIKIASDGTVVWHGAWTGGSGLLLDDFALLQVGVTQIQGKTVEALVAYDIAPSGERLSVSVRFVDGSFGTYLVVLPVAKATALPGCSGNPGVLATADLPVVETAFDVTMDQGQAVGALAWLAFATEPAAGYPCGIVLPGLGELLLSFDAPNPIVVLGGAPWTGAPVTFSVPVALPLYGETLFAQGLFLDPSGAAGGEPVRLTGGLELQVGP